MIRKLSIYIMVVTSPAVNALTRDRKSLFLTESTRRKCTPQLKKKLTSIIDGAPDVLPIRPKNVPPLLASLVLFHLWSYLRGPSGKFEKRPCSEAVDPIKYKNLRKGTLDEVARRLVDSNGEQIADCPCGIGLTCDGINVWALDIDGCVDVDEEGEWIIPPAVEVLAKDLGAYVEVSVSGTGLRFVVLGKCPLRSRDITVGSNRTIEVKINPAGTRFVTISGHIVCNYLDTQLDDSQRVKNLREWFDDSTLEAWALKLVGVATADEDEVDPQPAWSVDSETDLATRQAADRRSVSFYLSYANPERVEGREGWLKANHAITETTLEYEEQMAWSHAISSGGTELSDLADLGVMPTYDGQIFEVRNGPAPAKYILERQTKDFDAIYQARDAKRKVKVTLGTLVKWAEEDSGKTFCPHPRTTAEDDFGASPVGEVLHDCYRDYFPTIVIDGGVSPLHKVVEQTLGCLGKYGDSDQCPGVAEQVDVTDRFYHSREGLSQIRRGDNGRLTIQPLDEYTFPVQASRAVRTVKERITRDGNVIHKETSFPAAMAKQVLGATGRNKDLLPPLDSIRRRPYIGRDGGIIAQEGYSRENRTYLVLPSDFRFELPDQINRERAKASMARLIDCLRSFRFSRGEMRFGSALAAIISLILSPLVRSYWGTCPAFLITAKRPGAGKSTVVTTAASIIGDVDIQAQALKSGDEATKTLESALLQDPNVLWFDNASTGAVLGNETIEGLLTSENYRFRLLGGNRVATARPTVIAVTGNNTDLSKDMPRRTLQVSLDRYVPTPGIEDYSSWILSRADSLLADALTVMAAYIAEARRLDAIRYRDDGTPYVCPNAILEGMAADDEYDAGDIAVYRDAVIDSFAHWSTVVPFACLWADPGMPEWIGKQHRHCDGVEWRLNPSSALALRQGISGGSNAEEDEENRALVTILDSAVRDKGKTSITAAEVLLFVSTLRGGNGDEVLREAIEICEAHGDIRQMPYDPGDAHRSSKTLGRRLAALAELGGIQTLNPQSHRLLKVIKSTEGKKASMWSVKDVGWG